jgi:hypothetical protein
MDIMNTGVISLYVLSARRGRRRPVAGPGSGAFADPLPRRCRPRPSSSAFHSRALLIVYVMDLSGIFTPWTRTASRSAGRRD